MRVKVCGITREEDALVAVQEGAHMLGFIFVPSSPRYVGPESARSIIAQLPDDVLPVGVFVNATTAEIRKNVDTTGIRLIQLHGDESPEAVRGFDLPIWKAFRVRPGFDPSTLMRFTVDGFLLDAYVPGQNGGTGTTFDWEFAVAAKKLGRIILSGGITSENVAEAIRTVSPYAIDVSSGVESSPGIKDARKVKQLFDAIRKTQESPCSSS